MKFVRASVLILCALALVCCSVGNRSSHTVERAFYFWRTSIFMHPKEVELLDTLDVKTMYLRFFDVDWNEVTLAHPVAPLTPYWGMHNDQAPERIVPVVFITNRTFKHITDQKALNELAGKVLKKIRAMQGNFYNAADSAVWRANEIQIDCDWSESTKESYFAFLSALREQMKPVKLSVTVRLYQFRYPDKAGVPPADRGLLMCYNMNAVNRQAVNNSIFDLDEAKKYLARAKPYSLPMDMAVPVFSWAALFRGEKFLGLLDNYNESNINKLPYFVRTEGNRYRSTADTVLNNIYIRKGDMLRLESVRAEDLEKIAELAADKITNDTLRVAMFDLDSSLTQTYGYEKLGRVYESFNSEK